MLEGKATDGRRLLRDVGGDLELTIFEDGTAKDADADPTVTVTRADGTAVATDAATTKPPATTGIYRFTLSAANAPEVDRLKAVWKATISATERQFVTRHELVGAFYVTEKDIRDFDTNLTDTAKFPDVNVLRVIDWFEDTLEGFIGRSLIPRYHREVLDGEGSDTIYLERRPVRAILSAEVDGTAISDFTDWHPYPSGKLVRDDGESFTEDFLNVEITYEHGEDEPSEEVRSEALIAIRARLTAERSGIPAQARSIESSAGTVDLQLADDEHPTGIASFDALLRRLKPGAPVVR